MKVTPEERWDSEFANWLIGKYVLVGVTYLKAGSSEVDQLVQVHGDITSAIKNKTIELKCRGTRIGETFKLPPDTAIFSPGQKCIYRLRGTNEEVDSPDAIATWDVYTNTEDLKEVQ